MPELNKSRSEYMLHVEKHKQSGLSLKEYCSLNNLVKHKLSYYRNYKPKESTSKSTFAKIKLSTPSEIKHTPIDPVWLAQLIKHLMLHK